MKREITAIVSMVLAISLVGCGEAQTGVSTDSASEVESIESSSTESATDEATVESTKLAKDEIKIEDIAWEVTTKINDYGDRRIVVEYTNNSKYPVFGFTMTFTLKEGLTDEDMSVFDDLKTEYDYTDEELYELTMRSNSETYTLPGETSKACEITLGNYWRFPTSMDQMNNMEPDIATIGYLTSDGVLHIEYYDFKGQSYTLSDKTLDDTQQLPTSFKEVLPDISAPIIVASKNEETVYVAQAYGVSSSGFNDYVNACKEAGFTNDSKDSNGYYSASDANGNKLTLSYYSDDEIMSIDISNK